MPSEASPSRRLDSVPKTADAGADVGTVTGILRRRDPATDTDLADAVEVIYHDLRRIACRLMASEPQRPTFDPESLTHEVYLRLVGQDRTRWRNRGHLFAVAARIMRRVLVDRARHRDYAKHGGHLRITTLDDNELVSAPRRLDVRALDDALAGLEVHDRRLAQLVELRFFGGLTNPEIAEVQGVTTMTIIRRWRLARAWLHRQLRPRSAPP